MQILISGAIPGPEHRFGVKAVLALLDTASREISLVYEYSPPAELFAGQNVQFTGYAFGNGILYVCVFNEVLMLKEWPRPRLADRITHPGFNDLHHCLLRPEGLVVANTGLETIDYVAFDGTLKHRWDLLSEIPGVRIIDPNKDYRLVPDTKPHLKHVNHVFEAGGNLWSTQLRESAAICVTDSGRIPMEVGMPHDGVRAGDERLFTTTNGHLVIADAETGVVLKRLSLAAMTPGLEQLGWCRGVARHPENPDLCFVAFTKARRSKWKEVGYRLRHGHPNPASRIALYDLRHESLIDVWPIGDDPGLILFQIHIVAMEKDA